MSLSQIAVLAYGVVYFVLASAMEADNISQSYPIIYVGLSMVAQILVVGGVFLFGLGAGGSFTRLWRWLFPLLVAELAVGLFYDATIPAAPQGPEWFATVLLSLWFVMPAYYFNFRIAGYGRVPERP